MVWAWTCSTDAAYAGLHCTSKTRLLLRAAEATLSGSDVTAWSPVCGCGTLTTAATPYASSPTFTAKGGDGPGGAAYVDFRADGTDVDRSMTFGTGTSDRAPFFYDAATGGFHVNMVVRLELLDSKAENWLFSVSVCVWVCVCGGGCGAASGSLAAHHALAPCADAMH